MMTCSDEATVGVVSTFIKMGFSFQEVLEGYFWVGTTACLLYLMLMTESPTLHLLQDGMNSKKAISAFNYIAWFNGISYRISEDATFTLEKPSDEVSLNFSKSRISLASHDNTDKDVNSMLKKVQKLSSCNAASRMHWMLCFRSVMKRSTV